MSDQSFDILVVKNTIEVITSKLQCIETDISRVNEVINSHAREQAVFAYRHEQAKQISDKLEQIVDRINERGEEELRATIEMIDKREERLNDSIVSHKEIILREVALQHQTLKQAIDSLQKSITDLSDQHKEQNKTVDGMKKWMWMILGGASVLGLFTDKLVSLITG